MRIAGMSLHQLRAILGTPVVIQNTGDTTVITYRFESSYAVLGVPHVEVGVDAKTGKIAYYSATFDELLDARTAMQKSGIPLKTQTVIEHKHGHRTYVRVSDVAGLPSGWHVSAESLAGPTKTPAKGFTLVSVSRNAFQ